MLTRFQRFGQTAENQAARHLKRQGYRIVIRNYRTPVGEIDIIAQQGNSLVFVEVKARRSDRFGNPKMAVTRRKQGQISRAALWYLKETGQMQVPARFDVVAITEREGRPVFEIVRNAFELRHGTHG
jgi:putative endonuclease